ncbi:hypothetical protein M9H77_10860 [Catharanthus roseus]|uniref:Uncharacterized protein n=1 Tax=Catharanthus roseus TaxID=4058 RepID=A0ACC0BCY8_CATRO|nr:hypothetical protein M9H77_10860 [Catharanthus roseus]
MAGPDTIGSGRVTKADAAGPDGLHWAARLQIGLGSFDWQHHWNLAAFGLRDFWKGWLLLVQGMEMLGCCSFGLRYGKIHSPSDCESGGSIRKYKKPLVDDEEEEIPKKKYGPYGTKKCGCPFKLKGEQMATSENWQLFVHNGRHNHSIVVYSHGHAQAARLTEEQLQQTEKFRKSHIPPDNILRFFREQDVGCAVSSQKIYNFVAKIKRDRMQGRNMVEEVLRLSAERGYTVFYRNGEEATYNMPLLECVGMTPTGKNFTVAIAFM